jgi:hypothetical protein
MSAKVLSLSREAIRPSVRVEPDVIKVLENFLDEARTGEVIAGAIVLVRRNATICSVISAPLGGRHHLVAACDYLKQDVIAETDNWGYRPVGGLRSLGEEGGNTSDDFRRNG